MRAHPFASDRHIGRVFHIEGSFIDITFSAANRLPRSHFGEYLARGEVGEFIVVDVGGIAVFGRVLSIGTAPTRVSENIGTAEKVIPVEGRAQLLSTVELGGTSTRGVTKYPKVGDAVYAAGSEVILSVIGNHSNPNVPVLRLGRLSVDESVPVDVPMSRLFGRHLAIVGATGSGKSWTLGHIAESLSQTQGKMILIDASGEFCTLGDRAQHLAFASRDHEPSATLVGIPHYMMRESDRNAFLNPAAASQLPKLREAVRTLRLAEAISSDKNADPSHCWIEVSKGAISKTGQSISAYESAIRKYASDVENPHYPFEIKLLGDQIRQECIWQTDRNDPSKFGGADQISLGYVSSLVSRITDLLQTREIMEVITPSSGAKNVIEEISRWLDDPDSHVLRISLRNLTFSHHLREIVVNLLGQRLLDWAREGSFRTKPLLVAVDEAHQFFNVTVGDEMASSHLHAFDSIAKEGRKYGLTVCVATQRPADLPAGVLSQVGMTIVHRLADGRDRQRVEQAAAELDHSATKLLPGLVLGEAILMGVDFPVPMSVRIQKPSCPPASDGPSYDAWTALPTSRSGANNP